MFVFPSDGQFCRYKYLHDFYVSVEVLMAGILHGLLSIETGIWICINIASMSVSWISKSTLTSLKLYYMFQISLWRL